MPKKQQKMASNKKMQENKPTLKFNFTWECMWPVLILGSFCSRGPIQRALLAAPVQRCIVSNFYSYQCQIRIAELSPCCFNIIPLYCSIFAIISWGPLCEGRILKSEHIHSFWDATSMFSCSVWSIASFIWLWTYDLLVLFKLRRKYGLMLIQ